MTEPVAYVQIKDGKAYSVLRKGTPNDEYTPVYTAEQLHPRVKMTQKQYDRLMWDKQNSDLFQCIDYFTEHNGSTTFGIKKENLLGDLTQEDIARAWLNPEETIEIVPEMKWFVIAKNKYEDCFAFLKNKNLHVLEWIYSRNDNVAPKRAFKFDTEEQAELWTNPLTKAVQLPVEGE